jgi:hypothetical protein
VTENRDLVPLRVPNGWAVLYNVYFADVEMEISAANRIVNDEAYKQDLLWIKQVGLIRPGSEYGILDDGYQLDLGWYPDSDPTGAYRLVVMRRSWDDVLFDLTSADRHVVARAIERVMDGFTRGESPAVVCAAIGGRPR